MDSDFSLMQQNRMIDMHLQETLHFDLKLIISCFVQLEFCTTHFLMLFTPGYAKISGTDCLAPVEVHYLLIDTPSTCFSKAERMRSKCLDDLLMSDVHACLMKWYRAKSWLLQFIAVVHLRVCYSSSSAHILDAPSS